ncbi:MAG: hypothetical protein JRI69_14145 [Deltaproteobacteria bacterium]|nr:hypothetical protein [Deltaproteobacteria bacterium]
MAKETHQTKQKAGPVKRKDKETANSDVTALLESMKFLVDAVVDGKLDTRADVEKVDPAYRPVLEGVNQLIDAFSAPFNVSAEYVDRISKGDIPEPITDEYRGDFNEIKNNLNLLIDAMNGLINEAAVMEKAAADGELDTRADVSKYNGSWATIVEGLNNTVEGVVVPLRDIGGVLDRMAAGDLNAQVTNDYKGDYNVLKVASNELGDQFKGVREVLEETKNALVDGKLDFRGDASRFKGDIAGFVTGLNDVLDAFSAPFNVSAEYVDRISKGDIPEPITDEYKGDFNEIKNNLNELIDALNLIAEAAEKMAEGDLTVDIQPRSEHDLLLKSLAKMVANMVDTLGQAGIASEQVNSASGQVSASSQALAEGASEQAASLEETSSSLEEMASMVKQNAANSNQANTLMQETNQVVDKAKNSMNDVNTAMEDISKASEETSKIIKTIDEIAFQTNLLALNAAVEAARAGEAGAGFAVVADEVGNLAMRSAEAAKDTAVLIEGTVKKVNNGSGLVKTTYEAFEEVAVASAKVAELVSEISAASGEQSQGIEEINKAMAEMDKVTQQNAATAEEAASASEELSAQSNELDSMLARFDLGNHGNGDRSGKMTAPTRPVQNFQQAQKTLKAQPSAKAVPPETVIPMDNDEVSDGDFKDF